MVHGMDLFKERFNEYQAQYTVIGGMACDLLMSEAGLDFRPTQDIDMVLIVEALTEPFVRAFWQFINDGAYQNRMRSNKKQEFYRFQNPQNNAYPKMIELFSRPQASVSLKYEGHLMPLHISDEAASLSAILLNDDYYHFILHGRKSADGVTILDAPHIIPLKMKAWLDLSSQKAKGEHVNDRDLRKHRLDIFRLFALISPDIQVPTAASVLNDIRSFIQHMRTAAIGLKAIGITRSKDEILDVYERIYTEE
jgi:hypothetical protein